MQPINKTQAGIFFSVMWQILTFHYFSYPQSRREVMNTNPNPALSGFVLLLKELKKRTDSQLK